MIEVFLEGNRWAWRWISHEGRTLWDGQCKHDTDRLAFAAAKAFRHNFWAMASGVDHRQGACV